MTFVLVCLMSDICILKYNKTCVNGHSKMDKTKILMANGSLMKVESIAEYSRIAECSPSSILQYFWAAFKQLLVLKTNFLYF